VPVAAHVRLLEEPATNNVVPPMRPMVEVPSAVIVHPCAFRSLVPVFSAVKVQSMSCPDWVQEEDVMLTAAEEQKPEHSGLVVALIMAVKATRLRAIPSMNIATVASSEIPGLFNTP
jgi:hypothetical protein